MHNFTINKTRFLRAITLLLCVGLSGTAVLQADIRFSPQSERGSHTATRLKADGSSFATSRSDLIPEEYANSTPFYAPAATNDFDTGNPNENGGTGIGEVPITEGYYIVAFLLIMYGAYIFRRKLVDVKAEQ